MTTRDNPYRLNDMEFSQLESEFFSIISREYIRARADAHFRSHISHGSINQPSLFHLGIYQALGRLSKGEVSSILDQTLFGGTWFLVKFFVLAYRELTNEGRRRLVGMFRDNLNGRGSLHRLLSELLVYFDYRWLGLSVSFADLNDAGTHDLVVKDGDRTINVEVKTISLSSGEPWPEQLVRRVAAKFYEALNAADYDDCDLFTLVLLGRQPEVGTVTAALNKLPKIVKNGTSKSHLGNMIFIKTKTGNFEIEEFEGQHDDPDAPFVNAAFGGNNPALVILRRDGVRAVMRVRFNEPRLFQKAAENTLCRAAAQLPQGDLAVVHLHVVDAPSFEYLPNDFQQLPFYLSIETAFKKATRGKPNIISLTTGGMLMTIPSNEGDELLISGRVSAQIPNPEAFHHALWYLGRIRQLTAARRDSGNKV